MKGQMLGEIINLTLNVWISLTNLEIIPVDKDSTGSLLKRDL